MKRKQGNRRADCRIYCGIPGILPADQAGRNIEQVLDCQVDFPPSRVLRPPRYAAPQGCSRLNSYPHKENNKEQKVRQSWEEFLYPEMTRPRLVAASTYIAGFEALKDSVVGRIRNFFGTGFNESGDKIDPKYESDVLARNRSPVYASLEWLTEMHAIHNRDLAAFNRVKACRNTLAHMLFSTLGSEGLPSDFEQCLNDMVALLRKI